MPRKYVHDSIMLEAFLFIIMHSDLCAAEVRILFSYRNSERPQRKRFVIRFENPKGKNNSVTNLGLDLIEYHCFKVDLFIKVVS